MGHLPQNISRPLTHRASLINRGGGLAADPFTGAVNTAVLLFAQPAVRVGPDQDMFELNGPNAGTNVVIRKAGVYRVKFGVQKLDPVDVTIGISRDVDSSGFINVPSFAIAGYLDVQRAAGSGPNPFMEIESTVIVPPQQEGFDTQFGGTTIRFQAQLTGGGAPTSAFDPTTAYYSIQRINQAHS